MLYWVSANIRRFNGHFPGEPGLASCPLNSPAPFIPGLRILLGQAQTFHVILNTIPPGLSRASSLSNSFNLPRYTTFDPVIIIFSFNMSKPSQPTHHKINLKICHIQSNINYLRLSFNWHIFHSLFHVRPGPPTGLPKNLWQCCCQIFYRPDALPVTQPTGTKLTERNRK